jgi:hypothetical protein
MTIHVVEIDLAQPGLRFKVTAPAGGRETVRQRTVNFLQATGAQIGINAHFFEPFPSTDTEAFLIGPAASDGTLYSEFELPRQSYALMADAPALNIDAKNHAQIVKRGEQVEWFNAVAGSAQIITAGIKTIPVYGPGGLTPGGPNDYGGSDSWYERVTARAVTGLTRDARRLILLVVDKMTVGEAADFLIGRYGVWDALNLDGGGSTSLAMQDPVTHQVRLVNASTDGPEGRAVGSNLAVFAPSR